MQFINVTHLLLLLLLFYYLLFEQKSMLTYKYCRVTLYFKVSVLQCNYLSNIN